MNIRPEDKMFSKGSSQEYDEDGRPKMEKYIVRKAFDVTEGKVCRGVAHVVVSLYSPLLIMAIFHRHRHHH
jgi:hypothetical protein